MILMNDNLNKSKALVELEKPVLFNIRPYQTKMNSIILDNEALENYIRYISEIMPEARYLHVETVYDEEESRNLCDGYMLISSDFQVLDTDETLWATNNKIHNETYNFVKQTIVPETNADKDFRESFLVNFFKLECLKMKKHNKNLQMN